MCPGSDTARQQQHEHIKAVDLPTSVPWIRHCKTPTTWTHKCGGFTDKCALDQTLQDTNIINTEMWWIYRPVCPGSDTAKHQQHEHIKAVDLPTSVPWIRHCKTPTTWTHKCDGFTDECALDQTLHDACVQLALGAVQPQFEPERDTQNLPNAFTTTPVHQFNSFVVYSIDLMIS